MNRKLVNGFLTLAVAFGGAVTFTSCKDEDFRSDLEFEQSALQAQIDALRNVTRDQFRANLDKWLDALTGSYTEYGFNSYEEVLAAIKDAEDAMEIFQSLYDNILEGKALTEDQKKFVQGLSDWMNQNTFPNYDWFKQIYTNQKNIYVNQKNIENLMKRASSVDVNGTYNHVFGSLNLPIGLQTTILATYVVDGTNMGYAFPTGASATYLADESDINATNYGYEMLSIIKGLAPTNAPGLTTNMVEKGNYTNAGAYGNMGSAYVNINPTSVNFAGSNMVELVNSVGDVVFQNSDLKVLNNPDELKFGYTRAEEGSGVYKVNVNANDNVEVFDMKDATSYLTDVKDAIKDRSKSDIADLGKKLFDALNNKLDALAVKVSWQENEPTGEFNADNTPVTKPVVNSVLSTFDLAAAVVHPLSYGTPLNDAMDWDKISSKIKTFSPLEDYLDKISNKLTLENPNISGKTGELEINVTVVGNKVLLSYQDENGMTYTTELDYSAFGVDADPDNIAKFVEDILGVENDMLNATVIANLNQAIDDLNMELEKYISKVDDIKDYIDRIKNSSKIDYADKLIDVYNKIAMKAKKFLSNPEKYLQIVGLYETEDGDFHRMTTDPKGVGVEGGIKVIVANYTADVLVPSYLKYVAITAVNGDESAATLKSANEAAGDFANVVYPGNTMRFPLDLSTFSGKTLRITAASVDYSGVISMSNYYVAVK